METVYIKVGGEVTNWAPLRACSIPARYLWLSLYVSQRRLVPGLFVCGMPTICDMAKMQPDDAIGALDELIAERDLVEYDREREVLRLTEFPDRCERPSNGRHIKSLWTQFRKVPSCQVRDAHVRTLGWLLEDPSKPPTDDHLNAWRETFGTIRVPPVRKRGVRRLLDSDTGTVHQPSLFTKPGEIVSIDPKPDTVCDTVSDTHRSTIYDLRSDLSPDPDSNASASSAGDEQIPPPRALPSHDRLPLTTADVLLAVNAESAGRFPAGPTDDRIADALSQTVRACHTASVGLDDLRLVGRWIGAGGLGYRSDLGPAWASKPGNLIDAVASSRAWLERGAPALDADARRRTMAQPSPATAFGNGRKQL